MSQDVSYLQLKTSNDARLSEEQRVEQRKRNVMLLILQYLREEGYLDTANSFEAEAGPNLKKFEICDNIDLLTMIQEYETYHYIKFNRWPKISKRASGYVFSESIEQARHSGGKNRNHLKDLTKSNSISLPTISNVKKEVESKSNRPKRPSSDTNKRKSTLPTNQVRTPEGSNIDLRGQSIATHAKVQPDVARIEYSKESQGKTALNEPNASTHNSIKLPQSKELTSSERLLKPLSGYASMTSEWRELAAVINRDIYLQNPNVAWDDIVGLDEAKQLVKEAVVYPIKYPQLFTGILSPWKGLLLYGPPGTGKTLLAKAVATQCKTTFFNISASTIVSKWRGDSEKLVRVLFELARFHAPSTIFLDELDSVMSQRGGASGGGSEHEGSRRMKTELLVQMDGLSKSEDLVFLLAASNLPWELDHAMLRRLEKRIMVDLPSVDARKKMFEHFLPPKISSQQKGLEIVTQIDYDAVSKATEGYSGSDICLVCKEAAMRPVRKIFNVLETYESGAVDQMPKSLKIDSVTTTDIMTTLERTKPSSAKFKVRYEGWQKEFGSV